MTSEEKAAYDTGYANGYSDAQARYQRYAEQLEHDNRQLDNEITRLTNKLHKKVGVTHG